MRSSIHFLLIALMVFVHLASSFAARIEIQGVVIDEARDEFLPFANVLIKGTSVGAATDMNGRFSFTYETDESFTVVVRFMGYRTFEQQFSPDDDLSNLTFNLLEDVFQMETVVVTGIATRTSKEIAEIAVSNVDAAKLTETNAYQDISQLVAGKIPGVRIESATGNVGGGIRFNMRSGGGLNGDEQPVIYIDGIRVDTDEYGGDASPGPWATERRRARRIGLRLRGRMP